MISPYHRPEGRDDQRIGDIQKGIPAKVVFNCISHNSAGNRGPRFEGQLVLEVVQNPMNKE